MCRQLHSFLQEKNVLEGYYLVLSLRSPSTQSLPNLFPQAPISKFLFILSGLPGILYNCFTLFSGAFLLLLSSA